MVRCSFKFMRALARFAQEASRSNVSEPCFQGASPEGFVLFLGLLFLMSM